MMCKRTRKTIIMLCVALLTMAFLLSACSHREETVSPDLQEGISYLESLAERDPREVMAEQSRRAAERETTVPPTEPPTMPPETEPVPPSDLPPTAPPETEPPTTAGPSEEEVTLERWRQEAESNNVRMLSAEELAWFANRLSDTVFVGDSITQALITDGVLPESEVFYKRGVILREIGPTLDRALATYPKNVVFLKGLNDCDAEEPDTFIQRYADWVTYIREKLPGVNIFICSLLPPSKALGAVRPDLARSPEFDGPLQSWCPTAGVTYIDLHWLVYQHLYLSDGIHFTKSFYQLFLRYATVCIKGWEGVPR